MTTDPLDTITWVQFKAAFKIAAMALFEVTQARELASAQQTASDALGALQAEVRRFDESEQSWEPASQCEPLSAELSAQIREAIAATERGETVDLGSFAPYTATCEHRP